MHPPFDWPLSPSDVAKWAIPAAGIAAACLALYLGRMFGIRSHRQPRRPPDEHQPDPFTFGSASERRRSVRRKGSPVGVLVAQDQEKGDPLKGWVLNRSMGGLCLLLSQPMPIGSTLRVRSLEYQDTNAWSELEVVTCHPNGNDWELGCKFVQTPPWAVLLTFG